MIPRISLVLPDRNSWRFMCRRYFTLIRGYPIQDPISNLKSLSNWLKSCKVRSGK